ncbi:MAG: hypothetical protein GFH27_549297n191 [Chloroflexi bacterium AL-W]|nr:hypothetical protein [Chloroflexi bacterium AL-N1]NOK68955.1 hypothetical protein [Chloroflexi bacterium AL-N10]NOK76938.1 hypothetical protein [Chloroflexi bacterium AL-N5]NOK82674.1 hypothetical protein [Chloroflexi bacterium AL-W]NOK90795.1 hypothetical protein [Chloroflexi bacterium AL-N15]
MEDYEPAACTCNQSTPPDDLIILTVLDNEASEDITQHIYQCPHCMQRMHELATLQSQLHTHLYRAFCPSGETLVTFHQGLLEADQHDEVAEHITECPHCNHELTLLAEMARAPLMARPLLPQLQRITSMPLTPSPLTPFVFNQGKLYNQVGSRQYTYRVDNFQLALNIASSIDNAGQVALSGTFDYRDTTPFRLPGAVISLLDSKHVVKCAVVDKQGHFIMRQVTGGNYHLSLRNEQYEVVFDALGL